MGEGLRPHWHEPYCYREIEYDDHKRGVHVRKCCKRCMICQKELRPEFYYSAIKGPPIKDKCKNKTLEKHKKKFSNHK